MAVVEVNDVSYKRHVFNQLKQRNQIQSEAFKQLIQQHNSFLVQNKQLSDNNVDLQKEIARLTHNNTDLQKKINSLQALENDPRNVVELEKKISKLQEELTASYKRNSDNATSLLELNQQNKEMQEDLKIKEAEIELWKNKYNAVDEKCKNVELESKDKDLTMQILKEELKALQIEIVKTEDRVKKLTSENQTLVDRWLKKVTEDAEKMNEANALYASMVDMNKQLEMKKKMEEDKAALNASQLNLSNADPSLLDKLEGKREQFAVVLPTKAARTIEAHKGDSHSVAYSSSGHLIASGGDDNTIKLWDSRTSVLKSTLLGSVQSVMCVSFSPNDEFVLGSSNDNTIRLWSTQYGRVRHTLTGHTARVLTASFSGDSQKVISGSHDRSIKIYDLMKGYCIRTILCFSSCNSVCTSYDTRLICSGHFDHQIRFWDSKSGECGRELAGIHTGQVTSVSLSNDGRYVLSNSRDNTLKLIDIRTFDVVNTFTNEAYRNGVNWNTSCFSPDSKYVAAGGADGKLFIWDALTAKSVAVLKPPVGALIESTAWSPVGSQIATSDKSGIVTIWT